MSRGGSRALSLALGDHRCESQLTSHTCTVLTFVAEFDWEKANYRVGPGSRLLYLK